MKKIVLFGAGKSATVLIEYLEHSAKQEDWKLVVVDADLRLAQSKIHDPGRASAMSFDVQDVQACDKQISEADLVISLLPPSLHRIVADGCARLGKNLITASYIDEEMRRIYAGAGSKNMLFLCEMGLDPGMDHMSAMKIIERVREAGGTVTSFKSHCGGLVAPESDDNPWHYKISWNPRNILLAGKAGAHYRENGQELHLPYEELFSTERLVEIPAVGFLGWYPNRDSLCYASQYGLQAAETLVRTTLRHPDFIYGWKNIIELKLTDEVEQFDSDGKTLMQFFRQHMEKHGFGDWLQEKLTERLNQTKSLLENLMKLVDAEKEAGVEGEEIPEKFMMVDGKGRLEDLNLEEIKTNAAATVAHKMHEANLTMKQLFYLGMDDDQTLINKGICSPADVLQLALEKKLALQPDDKDMVVMFHEIEYTLEGKRYLTTSTLVVKGENGLNTAMAKTVGLPLGIAAKLILNGSISLSGLHIPISKAIYEPVLIELERHGVKFSEETRTV